MSRKVAGKGMSQGMPVESVERQRDGRARPLPTPGESPWSPKPPAPGALTRLRRHALEATLKEERHRLLRSQSALARAEQELAASQADEGTVGGPAADVASDAVEQELDLSLERISRS